MKKVLVFLFSVCVLVAPAQAGAATWTTWLGEQTLPPKGVPKGASLNQFFPHAIQIHVGDKIRFVSMSFHTASYRGSDPQPALAGPDPGGAKLAGINDAAGNPFYFNGLPKFLYNLVAFGPAPGAVNGTGARSTGVLTPNEQGKPGVGTLAFTKKGTFKLYCNVHPGMTQTVVVKAKKAKVLTAKQDLARAKKEVLASWAKAKQLATTSVPPNTVYAGVGGTTTLLAFLPAKLTVPVGTTVQFVNKSTSEPHNEVFGDQKWIQTFQEQTDLFPFSPAMPNQFEPVFIYGSDPAVGGVYSYDGKSHGNGFFATPLTDVNAASPLPEAVSIKFTAPGTFHFFCLLHGPDMSGDIVVT